jgi:hypothetical protein
MLPIHRLLREDIAMPCRKIAALLLACLLAGCDDATAPQPAAVDLAFDIERPQTEPPFLVSDGDGQVTVRGTLRTPCIGYTARAAAKRVLRTVEVRIIGINPGLCFHALGNYGYQATVRGLPAGEYHLRVVHTWPETGWGTDQVVDTQVRVR